MCDLRAIRHEQSLPNAHPQLELWLQLPSSPKKNSISEAIVKRTMGRHHACVTYIESNLYRYDIYFLTLSVKPVIFLVRFIS